MKNEAIVLNTKQLRGEKVVVHTRASGLKYRGELLEYFQSNDTIILRNYGEMRLKDEEWETIKEGDLMVIRGRSWTEIFIPKLSRELKKSLER